jgi:hypothetical protein
MRRFYSFLILLLVIPFLSFSQVDSTVVITAGNSCEAFLKSNKQALQYSYNAATQTHDYSGNWDFDGDGHTDGLFFVGTGGAHLFFYLRIILSSDKKIRDFPFLELDMPCPGTLDELKKANLYSPPFFPQFVVDKFSESTVTDRIYLRLYDASAIPAQWRKKGVNSVFLLLEYEKGEINIRNFIQ